MLIQIHDFCDKGILSGIGAADRYRNGHGLRGGGGMPFDPDYLAVTGWDHYIIDPVGGAENMDCLLYTSSSANWPLIWCLGEQTFNLLSDAGDDRIVEEIGRAHV